MALRYESRLRGVAACEAGTRGAASSPSVGVEPKSTALPQEGQKRAAPETSFPQAGQLMIAGEYITARFQAPILYGDSVSSGSRVEVSDRPG